MIIYNRETGQFEREGKVVTLTDQGAHQLVGWMLGTGKISRQVAAMLRSFARFKIEVKGKTYDNERLFK